VLWLWDGGPSHDAIVRLLNSNYCDIKDEDVCM